ncbi:MAG: hypothetical protein AABX65_01745 [Nanoarchaeota archaeon]
MAENTAAVSKEEQIGFHKGAIQTLLNERNELFRIVKVTETLIQAHAKELEALGVKLQQEKPSESSLQDKI